MQAWDIKYQLNELFHKNKYYILPQVNGMTNIPKWLKTNVQRNDCNELIAVISHPRILKKEILTIPDSKTTVQKRKTDYSKAFFLTPQQS